MEKMLTKYKWKETEDAVLVNKYEMLEGGSWFLVEQSKRSKVAWVEFMKLARTNQISRFYI